MGFDMIPCLFSNDSGLFSLVPSHSSLRFWLFPGLYNLLSLFFCTFPSYSIVSLSFTKESHTNYKYKCI